MNESKKQKYLNAPDDFDTTYDKESFTKLISDCEDYFGELDAGNQAAFDVELVDKFSTRLNKFGNSFDPYDYRDAYDSEEEGFEDIKSTVILGSKASREAVLDDLKRNYEESFDEPYVKPIEPTGNKAVDDIMSKWGESTEDQSQIEGLSK